MLIFVNTKTTKIIKTINAKFFVDIFYKFTNNTFLDIRMSFCQVNIGNIGKDLFLSLELRILSCTLYFDFYDGNFTFKMSIDLVLKEQSLIPLNSVIDQCSDRTK